MQNRLHENETKTAMETPFLACVRALEAGAGDYPGFHSISAGGFAVSSLSGF
jgi:hypothetical protein